MEGFDLGAGRTPRRATTVTDRARRRVSRWVRMIDADHAVCAGTIRSILHPAASRPFVMFSISSRLAAAASTDDCCPRRIAASPQTRVCPPAMKYRSALVVTASHRSLSLMRGSTIRLTRTSGGRIATAMRGRFVWPRRRPNSALTSWIVSGAGPLASWVSQCEAFHDAANTSSPIEMPSLKDRVIPCSAT